MAIFSIGSATADDETGVATLWKTCGLTTPYNDPLQDFRFAYAKPNSDILVGMTVDKGIIGSVMVGHDGHRGWIYYVAAHPDYQKQGIGRRMVEAAERWLAERHVVKAMLMVRETNRQVIDFYKHIGFETIPNTVMQKWLKKPAS